MIELMVVVVIIAILTRIVLVSLSASKQKSRDAKRVSDIAQIQLALEQYFDRCQQYPATLATTASNGCPTTPPITLASFITVIPRPSNEKGQSNYDYLTGGAPPNDYNLHAILETKTTVLNDSIPESLKLSGGGFHCYDATNYPTDYCVGSK
jgi:type II secretory pathway pseudopilin PulG